MRSSIRGSRRRGKGISSYSRFTRSETADGSGWGFSTPGFLPFAESDFILSVIGEEFGFVGILLLFAAAGALIWFGIRTAARSRDLFGFLVASGITLVYAIQVVVNALVVSGSIPPTGLPLPLISSGNTSLIFTMAALGVLYNISKSAKRAPARAGGFAEKRRAGAP